MVPTYNRPDALRNCLQALSLLDFPKDLFEVVIVDDGGHLPIEDVVDAFTSKLNITLLAQDNAGPAKARNTGIRSAAPETAQGQFNC